MPGRPYPLPRELPRQLSVICVNGGICVIPDMCLKNRSLIGPQETIREASPAWRGRQEGRARYLAMG